MDRQSTARFYDAFATHQQRVAYNERHFFLYDFLRRLGLDRRSRVLELGCGIGVITSLIASRVTQGRVVAVDISPASIEMARRTLATASGVELLVGDVTNFRVPGEFDFVTLLDVLEHVPTEHHHEAFHTLAAHSGDRTTIVVNIPHPRYIEYRREHEPHLLQAIDQPVAADVVLGHAYAHGLELSDFHTYGIWVDEEYQLMLFRRRRPFVKAVRRIGLRQRLRARLGRLRRRLGLPI